MPAPTLELDPHAVLKSLGMAGVTRLKRVPFGVETDLWRVESGGNVYALRVFRPGEGAKGARERAALTAAAEGVPVPKVVAQGRWGERLALLLSWLPGRMAVLELTVDTPWERVQSVSEALGRTLAAVHRIPAPSVLRRAPHAWIGLAGPDERHLQAQLLGLPLRTDALLHLDYHPLNVMVGGERVTGVLDWSGVTAGDSRADFAKVVTLFTLAPVSPRPGAPAKTPAEARLREHIIAAFEKGYREMGELEGDLSPFYAWAGAAVLHNVRAKIGRPGEAVEEHHLEPVRRWTEAWKRRAGLRPAEASGGKGVVHWPSAFMGRSDV